MAQRKSKTDILRNEKYMDDAVFSALMNLHKAAKRKSEYIWATEKFNSLDSIWGDSIESKNSKVLNVASNASKDPDQKPLKRQYSRISTELNSSRLIRNDQIDLKLDPYDARKTKLLQKPENFQNQQTFYGISPVKSDDHSRKSIGRVEETSRLILLGRSAVSAIQKVEGNEFHKHENELQSNPKSKMQSPSMPQKEKTEKPKRKRHYSSSSVNSLPDRKPVKNQNIDKTYDTDKKGDMLRTMLVMKIFKGEKFYDFVLELSDFKRIMKKFPKLQEVFPEIDGEEKELCYSPDAVKIVFGFLRNLWYDTTDERTAVEVLAASKAWEVCQFYAQTQQKFLKNLNKNNIHLVYGAAVHYGLNEICDAYQRAFADDLSSDVRPYRHRKCTVSVSTYIEPREFCIPSKTVISTLHDNFDKDIRNEMTFKAVAGSYVITGFRIRLNLENEKDVDSTNLQFYYVVRNPQNRYEEEVTVRKRLRSNIAINLQRNLEVNRNQTAEIAIETSIKPYLCLAVQEDNIAERCDERQFCMSMKSTYKVANSNEMRFFVGKLLYYPKS